MIKAPLAPLRPNHKTQGMLAVILSVILLLNWTIILPCNISNYIIITYI